MIRSNPTFSKLSESAVRLSGVWGIGAALFVAIVTLSSSAFAIDFFHLSDHVSDRAPATQGPTKPELIVRFKDIQGRLSKEIQTIDDSVKKLFQETTNLSLHAQDASGVDKKLLRISDQLATLETKRNELAIRRDFIDQVIFTVDTKWTAQPLKAFFESQFLDLAFNDFTDPRGDGRMWKFMLYLSITVREVPEPREDIVNVIESYMDYSSILTPKTPADFLNSRNYTNGSVSITAKAVDKTSLGEYLETRLKELKANKVLAPGPTKTQGFIDRPDIELRLSKGPPTPLIKKEEAKAVLPTTSLLDKPLDTPKDKASKSSKDDQFYISPMIKSDN